MPVECTHVRRGKDVKDVVSGAWTDHFSINKAKRWSREHQKKNGGLGAGSVRVEAHK